MLRREGDTFRFGTAMSVSIFWSGAGRRENNSGGPRESRHASAGLCMKPRGFSRAGGAARLTAINGEIQPQSLPAIHWLTSRRVLTATLLLQTTGRFPP